MSTNYDDIIAAADPTGPTRTRRGALRFQPPDADWNLGRLDELRGFYQSTYKRPLPLAVIGQGTIHNKWGYDHRNSADISLDPRTAQGQALIAEMQRRNIPFLAFEGAIPGVATGPHIHVGRPSSSTSARYGVGSKVRKTGQTKQTADNYDDIIAAADDTDAPAADDYSDIIEAAAEPKRTSPAQRPGGIFSRPEVRASVAAAQPDTGIGALRRTEDAMARQTADTGVGRLRQLDEPAIARRRTIEREVRGRRAINRVIPQPLDAISGLRDLIAGKTEDQIVDEEVNARLATESDETARLRELTDQLTADDKRIMAEQLANMRGMGSVSRGIETGSQRVGSGLLYKLAGMIDVFGGGAISAVGPKLDPTARGRSVLGDYLRRQAGRGELTIQEIEAELPPNLRQQFADFLTTAVGTLPEIIGATSVAGPIGGFAALGGLEAAGRKKPLVEVAREAAKGAALGAVFHGAGAVESRTGKALADRMINTAQSGVAIGAGTYGVEKAFGADDYDAARSAASNVLFHAGMRAADTIGRMAQSAERALKTAPEVPKPSEPAIVDQGQITTLTEAELKTPDAPSTPESPLAVAMRQRAAEAPEPTAEVLPKVTAPEPASLAEAIAKSQVPFAGPPAYGEGIAPRQARVVPSGDKALDAAREVGLDYGIEVVEVPGGYTIQRSNGQHIADVVTSAQAEAVVRKAILAEPLPTTDAPVELPPQEVAVGEAPATAPRKRTFIEEKQNDPEYRQRLEEIGLTSDEIRIRLTPTSELNEVERAVKREVRKRIMKAQLGELDRSLTDMVEDVTATATRLQRQAPSTPTTTPATPSEAGPPAASEPASPAPKKTLRERLDNEGGFIDVTEIARGVRKLRDFLTSDKKRNVLYTLNLPSGRRLGVNLTIDKEGVAYTRVGPMEKFARSRDFSLGKEKLDVGVETLLGLKRYLLQAHPEITKFEFKHDNVPGSLTPVRRSTPEPVREINLDELRTKLGERKLELRESTDPIPTFSIVDASGREAAKFANRDRSIALQNAAEYAGIGRPKTVAPDFETRQRLNRTEIDELVQKGFDADSLAYYNRTDPIRLKRLYTRTVVRGEQPSAADLTDIGTGRPPTGQGGFVDLDEIREGLRSGKLKIDEAVEELRKTFKNVDEKDLRIIANREHDPIIGVVGRNGVEAIPNHFRAVLHSDAFGYRPTGERWRYEPAKKTVYWDDPPSLDSKVEVKYYLEGKGLEVKYNENIGNYNSRKLWAEEEAALDQPHHSTVQPRTETGQFAPGEPGGTEAERSMLRSEARKYREQFQALDNHLARREGLDIVNDGVAANYFAQLRRITRAHQPDRVEAVDRAETLYNQGKYGQATMLAESVFRGLPDKVAEYGNAYMAANLEAKGAATTVNWRKVMEEVKRRLKETGPPISGGSVTYDVNKYPKGGLPDHAKIAYIVEPVVEAIRADARRLIDEGKLKAADYVAHVRSEVAKLTAGPDFADWHPINKSAAMGVLVDRLRSEGPPVGGPPVTQPPAESAAPRERNRSLPKTLEASGRDPGEDTTYTQLPNRPVNERVQQRLETEGVDALEAWYRTADASPDRTAAHRILVDYYTAEAVNLADTAPETAQQLLAHARDLSTLEDARATTLGQAVQMYSQLLKYTPAGVMREVASLQAKGVKVSDKVAADLAGKAVEARKADKEVTRLERKLVEQEAAEEPVGQSSGDSRRSRKAKAADTDQPAEPGRPRRYRPRADAPDTPAERTRRQLDEAAQRRRASRMAIAQQLRQLEQQRTITGYYKRSINITRGLMVSAFSTAMRNLQSQVLRFDIERLDDMVEHTIRRAVGLDSDLTYRNIWRNTARQFRFNQTAEAREILTAHPGEYTRMFNNYAGGVDVPIPHPARAAIERTFQTVERGVEIANFFNRVQEFHVRSAEFLAELDLHLRKEHNQTLEQYVQRNGIDAIPLEIVRRGVDKALEVTFADMPGRDGAGGRLLNSLIEVGNYIPPTVSPVAFPRFLFNNIKFLYQHSPAGMLDLARRSQNRPRVIARALVGTSMLLLAYQFRNSDHAGEKWYELKFGGTTLDARPFGPFSTYLFLAEQIRRAKAGEKLFTLDEIGEALGANTAPGGTVLGLAQRLYDNFDQWNSGSETAWIKGWRTLKTEGGEWGRALLTPVRQVKDLVAAFDASQAINRDTSSEPFLGPMKESIPYADTNLPPAYKPTTATPVHQEHPAVKAITGWRAITPKTFIEHQLDELNFTPAEIKPSTGDPAIDALEKRLMGPIMDELSDELEQDAEWKTLSKRARAEFLRDLLIDIRKQVRKEGQAEQPELYEHFDEDRQPRREREFNQELNSPGLSKALQLGVPMSIPPMRPGEDDIAYRARLLQLGRQRRAKLDGALTSNFDTFSRTERRNRLREAVYS